MWNSLTSSCQSYAKGVHSFWTHPEKTEERRYWLKGAALWTIFNYWVFTSTALVGIAPDDASQITAKFFYLLFTVPLAGDLASGTGQILDNQRVGGARMSLTGGQVT